MASSIIHSSIINPENAALAREVINSDTPLIRLPANLKAEFRHYRLRDLVQYVKVGGPSLAVLTIGLMLITTYLMQEHLNESDQTLWLWGCIVLGSTVLLGTACVQISFLRQHYTIIASVLATIALIKMATMPQLLGNPELIKLESYFCIFGIIIVTLALKLSFFAGVTIYIISAIFSLLVLLLAFNTTPDYVNLFYYYFATAKICLFLMKMREQQEIKEFLQAVLIAYDGKEKQQLNEELSRLAHQDALSGLYNRRHFDNTLTQEWERHLRTGKNLALLFIDIDHFKPFNDTYGHAAGDECITAVGQAIQGSLLRPGDIAARYGGEEFVVLLPDTNSAGAHDVAIRVQQRIDALQISHTASKTGHITASIGFAAMLPKQHQSSAFLLKQADNALYAAKQAGRHCIRESVIGGSAQTALTD